MTMNEDIRYTIALSRILVLYPAVAQLLYREFGSAQAVYENRNRLTETVPDYLTPTIPHDCANVPMHHFCSTIVATPTSMRDA